MKSSRREMNHEHQQQQQQPTENIDPVADLVMQIHSAIFPFIVIVSRHVSLSAPAAEAV